MAGERPGQLQQWQWLLRRERRYVCYVLHILHARTSAMAASTSGSNVMNSATWKGPVSCSPPPGVRPITAAPKHRRAHGSVIERPASTHRRQAEAAVTRGTQAAHSGGAGWEGRRKGRACLVQRPQATESPGTQAAVLLSAHWRQWRAPPMSAHLTETGSACTHTALQA